MPEDGEEKINKNKVRSQRQRICGNLTIIIIIPTIVSHCTNESPMNNQTSCSEAVPRI